MVRASLGRSFGSIMDAEEMRAGEHKVSQEKFAYGEKDGDEDEVGSFWFLVPG